jgi:hypothetical protein
VARGGPSTPTAVDVLGRGEAASSRPQCCGGTPGLWGVSTMIVLGANAHAEQQLVPQCTI